MAVPDRPPVIVVADDDDLVRAVLRLALASESVHVREAADSDGLDRSLADGDVVLAILDISIPGPGLTANIRSVRHRAPSARILVLSGDTHMPTADAVTVDDFARKPIDLDELRSRVARLLSHEPPLPSAP
jgi:DNA-binding response OmpR family regulator